MARRRKGQRVDGWLVVDKPLGITSAGVVNKARWALQAQKAGHSGTLDPLASGCLAVAFGEATKTITVAQDGDKTYRFTVCWGAQTATDDLEGEVVATSAMRPGRADVEAMLPQFTGVIAQLPPAFSAVKVDGERAYDLARAGVMPRIQVRPIRVDRLVLAEMPDADHSIFEMTCGRGGYVRSIARDLGEVLGCLGHVSELRRLATGPFGLDRAIAFDAIEALREQGIPGQMLPLEAGLTGLPRLDVTAAQAADLRMGRTVATDMEDGPAWAAADGCAVAIGTCAAGIFQPRRVLAAPEA